MKEIQVEIIQDCIAYPNGTTVMNYKTNDVLSVTPEFCDVLVDAGYAKILPLFQTIEPEETPEPKKRKYTRRKK